MLQLLATMLFSGGLLLAGMVIALALAEEAGAIRHALGLVPQPVVLPPLPPQYRVASSRRAQPPASTPAMTWREAA